MSDIRPGFNSHRLITLIQQAIQRCELQLDNLTVLTEAATGAYVVTPIIAAMAGAKKVFAITQGSRYGTIEEVKTQTQKLAEIGCISDKIEFITNKPKDIVAQADIITNSGHVRPIDAEMISWMNPTAVIPLMYEAWELRPVDVDIKACRRRGIKVAGINERHPAVDVFSFLGLMAIKLLLDAGVAIYKSNILLLCDNHFAAFIENGLVSAGASIDTLNNISLADKGKVYDAILVAMQPRSESVLSAVDAEQIAKCWRGVVIAQFWGDIERSAFLAQEIAIWPPNAPEKGHMAILPSAIGPEPIIRLQTGGLKVGELLWHSCKNRTSTQDNSFSQELETSEFIDQII
ncbi:hypothetical protein [Anabaena sphaerica]|uniref:hypothetical protein n=1 Tax=Anabaena sphaerica TaxID=212446 RepID=UPI001F5518A7|nr:hypothetical protein [Anabaena sphaerica]